VHFSADGIHWGERVVRSGPAGDRTTAFYNPFRKVWSTAFARPARAAPGNTGRAGPADRLEWPAYDDPPLWTAPDDRFGRAAIEVKTATLAISDCVAYESRSWVFSIGAGDGPAAGAARDRVGFSRDGWHWHGRSAAFIDRRRKPALNGATCNRPAAVAVMATTYFSTAAGGSPVARTSATSAGHGRPAAPRRLRPRSMLCDAGAFCDDAAARFRASTCSSTPSKGGELAAE